MTSTWMQTNVFRDDLTCDGVRTFRTCLACLWCCGPGVPMQEITQQKAFVIITQD